jgi:hypothetical protein
MKVHQGHQIMMIKIILIYILAMFLGYAVGRIGHILNTKIKGGNLKSPHHWIYGLILVILGIIFQHYFWGVPALSFGLGIFVSDLKDFLDSKFYGVDEPGPARFWGID